MVPPDHAQRVYQLAKTQLENAYWKTAPPYSSLWKIYLFRSSFYVHSTYFGTIIKNLGWEEEAF
jgi:hypothetical protein